MNDRQVLVRHLKPSNVGNVGGIFHRSAQTAGDQTQSLPAAELNVWLRQKSPLRFLHNDRAHGRVWVWALRKALPFRATIITNEAFPSNTFFRAARLHVLCT